MQQPVQPTRPLSPTPVLRVCVCHVPVEVDETPQKHGVQLFLHQHLNSVIESKNLRESIIIYAKTK